MTHAQRTQVLRLADGRFLEYADCGDPRGIPVLYFHGFMGSCEQAKIAEDSAHSNGIRLIAPNRPGIGRSSPARFRVMTEYAGDIEQLADALGIERFAIVGASGGGSFALACTYVLADRATLVGVAGGIGPLDVLQNLQEMWWWRRAFLSGCHDYPLVTSVLLNLIFFTCKQRPKLFYQHLSWLTSSSGLSDDRRALAQEIAWRDYEAVFLQPNGAQAILREAALYFDWGFHLRDFPHHVHAVFWHSREDAVIPFTVTQRMLRHVRGNRTILLPGGHLMFLLRVQQLMASLKQELSQAHQPVLAAPWSEYARHGEISALEAFR